ncbi:MAG TPA: HEAT repeat domain-containing protein [Desulfobacterales bacterium]|nr:HEAT repeat domain-containing protein [Desulfobacterales bacterium]
MTEKSITRQVGDDELQQVKDVAIKFFLAIKNYSLYPEHHAISKGSIADFKTHLDRFFKNYGNLRIDVERERLLYRGDVIHQGPPDPENSAFLFYRDGIQWLEFQEGLGRKEILDFIKIIDRYKAQKEEAEGDIVTALWEAEFSSLNYGTNELLWEEDVLIDFSRLKVMEEEHLGLDKHIENQADVPSIADPGLDKSVWKLTAEEIKETLNFVHEEEHRNFDADLFDVLLVFMKMQEEKEDFAVVLDFIRESLQNTIAKGDFQSASKLLNSMREIYRSYKTERFWALPLLEDFFVMISSPQVLSTLSEAWLKIEEKDPDIIKEMRQMLLLLSPQAILTLGPMLLEVPSSTIHKSLMEVIGSLATRDLRPLIRLLDHPKKNLVQKAIYILGFMKDESVDRSLLKMVHDPSEQIREETLKALVRRKSAGIRELFPLIEDSSDNIRRCFLEYLGHKRSEEAENLLVDYLGKQRVNRKVFPQLLDTYRTLGRCGSRRSIPFLKDRLLNKAWIPGLGKSMHQQGAALALLELENKEAREILNLASKSRFPGVRNAYQSALELKNEQ